MFGILRSVLATLLFVAYPYLVYKGMQSGIIWTAPALIAALYIDQARRAATLPRKVQKLLPALLLITGALFFQDVTAKLVPVLIQLLLLHFFAATLRNGPPLIERFVRLEFPDFPPKIVTYCRQLTILWSAFFAFNAVMCALLALFAPDAWWAFYNGVMIYALTAALMIGEYVWRHFRFPELDIPSPQATVKSLIGNSRKIWQDVYAR
ncbi:MAG: hypothetical protein ACU837_12845 [Gammaproteobacteria bacterium]